MEVFACLAEDRKAGQDVDDGFDPAPGRSAYYDPWTGCEAVLHPMTHGRSGGSRPRVTAAINIGAGADRLQIYFVTDRYR